MCAVPLLEFAGARDTECAARGWGALVLGEGDVGCAEWGEEIVLAVRREWEVSELDVGWFNDAGRSFGEGGAGPGAAARLVV